MLVDVQDTHLHVLKLPVARGELISTSRQLLAYLTARLAFGPIEQLRVLYLDAAGRLVADELQGRGCTSELAIYPRQIVRRGLEVNAAGLILAHNHPSGDQRPSRADIDATRRVAEACNALGMILHDHLIVTLSGWSSFRLLGLL